MVYPRFSASVSQPIPVFVWWSSENICGVCFSYSTEVFFLSDKRYIQSQQDWILADLAAANQNRHHTPWVVAFGHRPMYCSNDDGDDCTKNTSLVRLGYCHFTLVFLFNVKQVIMWINCITLDSQIREMLSYMILVQPSKHFFSNIKLKFKEK